MCIRDKVKTSPFHGGNTGSIPVGVTRTFYVRYRIRRHSQVVRQRSATPSSPVQIWLAPLEHNFERSCVLLLRWRYLFCRFTESKELDRERSYLPAAMVCCSDGMENGLTSSLKPTLCLRNLQKNLNDIGL